MNPARASIGKQMFLLKNAKSITAREITEKEQGADHCNVDNQQAAIPWRRPLCRSLPPPREVLQKRKP